MRWPGLGWIVLILLSSSTLGAFGQEEEVRFNGLVGWIDAERHRLPDWQPAAPDPNGFDLYEEAWRLYQEQGLDDDLNEWIRQIIDGTATNAQVTLAALRAASERHSDVLALLHQAAAMDYLAPQNDDFTAPMPWLNSMRQLARLLVADAIASYDQGDMSHAFGSLEDAYAMSVRVSQNGALIDLLVGHAIFQMCQATQELFLRIGAAEADVLVAHARRLGDLSTKQGSFGVALIREGRAWTAFFDRITLPPADAQQDIPAPAKVQGPGVEGAAALTSEDLANIREWMEDRLARLAEAANQPAVASHIHRLIERTVVDLEARHDPLAETLLPVIGKVYDGYLDQREAWVVAQLLPAIEAYRLRHGQLPGSLDDLVPSVLPTLPTEPWTGEPPLYRGLPDGSFLIYSPGFDGKDDGGQMSLLEGNRGPDIVFYPPQGP